MSQKLAPVKVGVTGVRRSATRQKDLDESRVTAKQAGEASTLFPKGGTAFAAWVREQGEDPMRRRFPSEWQELLERFVTRPIHGYRRGPHGGSHEFGR